MKAPILRASFFSIKSSGLKSLTSQANRTENFAVSNFWMSSAPLFPATSAAQVVSTELPTGVTSPRPVTTTRRFKTKFSIENVGAGLVPARGYCGLRRARTSLAPTPSFALMLIDIVVRVAHALNLLGVLVRNFNAEFFFEAHYQLNRVERICAEIVDEAGV